MVWRLISSFFFVATNRLIRFIYLDIFIFIISNLYSCVLCYFSSLIAVQCTPMGSDALRGKMLDLGLFNWKWFVGVPFVWLNLTLPKIYINSIILNNPYKHYFPYKCTWSHLFERLNFAYIAKFCKVTTWFVILA